MKSVTFQSPLIHANSKVLVNQLSDTGFLEPSPASPNRAEYQTETLAVSPLNFTTLVPTGLEREMNVMPFGAVPSVFRPMLVRNASPEYTLSRSS